MYQEFPCGFPAVGVVGVSEWVYQMVLGSIITTGVSMLVSSEGTCDLGPSWPLGEYSFLAHNWRMGDRCTWLLLRAIVPCALPGIR